MGTVGSAQLVIMQSMILFSVVACAYGGYNGGCVNNLGQGVECASATTYNGACVNSLGQGVPCRERRSAQEGQYSPAAEHYVHVEIAAEPYVHQEIPAQPYQGATGYAGPAYGGYNGGCVNNLGQGVPCRNKRSAQEGQYSPVAEPYVHVEIAAEPYVHQEIPAQPYQGATGYAGPAYGGFNGGCVNNLGQGVPCRNKRSAQEGQYSPAAEPYVHVEIAAEPYVHQEIPAQPYQGAFGYAGPAYGGYNGGCVNNLGQGVPCRN